MYVPAAPNATPVSAAADELAKQHLVVYRAPPGEESDSCLGDPCPADAGVRFADVGTVLVASPFCERIETPGSRN